MHIGVDVARFGDDETVIAPRIGNKGFPLHIYNKQDTMVTAGWVINIARKMMKERQELIKVKIKVDDDGVGGGVTDRLNEVVREEDLPFEIIPVRNGSKAEDDHCENLGSEIRAKLKESLEENFSNSSFNSSIPLTLTVTEVDAMLSLLLNRFRDI